MLRRLLFGSTALSIASVALVTGSVIGVGLIAPGTANAAQRPSVAVSSGLVPVYDAAHHSTRLLPPQAAAAAIIAYWTPARRAAAIPDTQTGARVSSGAASTTQSPPQRLASPVPSKLDGGVRSLVVFTNTDGRVFFTDPVDGTNHACSGGAVNSGKKRLVWTAGHCVNGGPGRTWMTNWAFDPGYQFGPGPAGVFPAFQLWAQTGWTNNGDSHFDYGVGITQNNQFGSRLVDRVGGNGLVINPGRPFVTAIAYPVNFNGGQQQAFCQGTLSRRSIFNSDQQLNCDLRFGASGGPWLENYDSNGLGTIAGNQSYSLNSDGSGPEFGPYYDSDTAALYNAAENASP